MEEQNITKVRTLIENFDLMQITGDDASLKHPVVIADTSRPGLESIDCFENSQQKRLVILGDKEIVCVATMSIHKQRESFDFITNGRTLTVAMIKGHKCPDILRRYAKRENFPIFLSSSPAYRLIVDVMASLDEQLAISMCVHGGLLSIYGEGVLIHGESGVGKSEAALELTKCGHPLVVNDRVDCHRIHDRIVGKVPELLRGMLEIRRIDVIDVSRMSGVNFVLPKVEINFQVNLEPWKINRDYDRVGIEEKKREDILSIDIPEIVIPVHESRSMAVIIESAVTSYMLFVMGTDSVKEFGQRVLDYIEKNENE